MAVFAIAQHPKTLFRIIPHRSTLNSTSRRFFEVMHDVLLLDQPHSPLARVRRDADGKLAYQVVADLWWLVALRCTEEGKRADFYLAVPRSLAELTTLKFKNHPQWGRSTLEEEKNPTLTLPGERTAFFRLRLDRHDIFSLDYNYNEQNTPLRDLLHILDELRPGDEIHLRFRFQPLARTLWYERAALAWRQWNEGKMPQRLRLSGAHLRNLLLRGLHTAMGYAAQVTDDILLGIERSFYGPRVEETKRRAGRAEDPERQSILATGGPSPRSRQKQTLPVFSSGLYVAVVSDAPLRRKALAQSIASALTVLKGDNSLSLHEVSAEEGESILALEAPVFEVDSDLLSCDEVGKLAQLPTAELQEEYAREIEVRKGAEIVVPHVFTDPAGVFMGTVTVRNEEQPVYWPVHNPDWAYTPRVLMGSPGAGKDMALANMIRDFADRGAGAVILDVVDERNGYRGLSDAVRDHLPPAKVIDLDMAHPTHYVYMGPGLLPKSKLSLDMTDTIADIFTDFYMDGGDDEGKFQTRELMRDCAKLVGGDPLAIQLLLTNAEYRKARLQEAAEKGILLNSLTNYDAIPASSEGRRGMIAAPVLNRVGRILGNERLRRIFCQIPKSNYQLAQWLYEGKVIIYRIPNRPGAFFGAACKMLCQWVAAIVFLIKQLHGGKGAPTLLICNEPHQYLSPGFVSFTKRMFSEGRKYRLAPVFAFHHFSQFSDYPEWIDALISGNPNWHLLRNSSVKEYQYFKAELERAGMTPEQAQQATPNFHTLCLWLNAERQYERPFVLRNPDLIHNRFPSHNHAHFTDMHAKMYGRPGAEVHQQYLAALQKAVGH